MDPIQQLDDDLLGLNLSQGTIRVYTSVARNFLAEVTGTPDRHAVLRHLGQLRETTKSNTRMLVYYALRALFASMDWTFGVPRPQEGQPEEISRPCLTPKQVERMIA